MDQERDLEWFRAFVAGSRWRFAKTYVESYPHEYTVLRWPGTDADAFAMAIECIERWGVVESFWSAQRKYLYVDDRKYWHMGDVSSETRMGTVPERRYDRDSPRFVPDLINRTWLDVGAYRDEAARLGYDGEELDRLVARWRVLLEKAKRG